jgi:hypothetical protein
MLTDSKRQQRPDRELCYEPLGMGYPAGIVVCILPRGHEGEHDGGAVERKLGEHFAAQSLEKQMERDEW